MRLPNEPRFEDHTLLTERRNRLPRKQSAAAPQGWVVAEHSEAGEGMPPRDQAGISGSPRMYLPRQNNSVGLGV